jgi:hypothetical protein
MAEVSRRAVLSAGAALVVGGLVVGVDTPSAKAAVTRKSAARSHTNHKRLSRANYKPCVGKAFTAQLDGHSHKVVLTRIVHVDGATKKQADACFNLIFTAKRRLPEGIYSIKRRGLPTERLFLGHLGTEKTMQALVNRSR